MKVTTTTTNGSTYINVATDGSCLNLLMKPDDKTPEAALRREAEEVRRTAARLLARARCYEAAADILLTPAA